MNLAARLNRNMSKPRPAKATVKAANTEVVDHYFDIKTRIHDRLIDMIDLSLLDSLSEADLRTEIAKVAEGLLWDEFQNAPLNLAERKRMLAEVQDEVIGLGPLEPYVKDPSVNDILVNGYNQI